MNRQLEEQELYQVLEGLADAWVENLHEQKSTDPIQNYQQSVQSHIYANKDRFRKRFVRGYQLLLNNLKP